MFEGFSMVHIAIAAMIALIVLGPEKFPEYAKIALRAYRDLQNYINGIKRDIGNEIHPISRELNQLSRYNPEDYIEKLTEAVTSAADDKPKTEDIPAATETKPEPVNEEAKAEPPKETPPPAGEYEAFVAKGSTPAAATPPPHPAEEEQPHHAAVD